MTDTVEVSFPVEMFARIVFRVERGTVLTEEAINHTIDRLNHILEKDEVVSGGDDIRLSASISERDKNLPIEFYDPDGDPREGEGGAREGEIEIGERVGIGHYPECASHDGGKCNCEALEWPEGKEEEAIPEGPGLHLPRNFFQAPAPLRKDED